MATHPLQCSCLENPRDRGAWWAAIHGVTESQTLLKRLSSSCRVSNRHLYGHFHSSIIHSSENVEVIQESTYRGTGNMWCMPAVNCIYPAFRKGWNSDTCRSKGEPWKNYAKGHKPFTKWQALCDSTSTRHLSRQRHRNRKENGDYKGLWVDWGLKSSGSRPPVWDDKSSGNGRGDGRKMPRVLSAAELCT